MIKWRCKRKWNQNNHFNILDIKNLKRVFGRGGSMFVRDDSLISNVSEIDSFERCLNILEDENSNDVYFLEIIEPVSESLNKHCNEILGGK